jgi:hypothetical protein
MGSCPAGRRGPRGGVVTGATCNVTRRDLLAEAESDGSWMQQLVVTRQHGLAFVQPM